MSFEVNLPSGTSYLLCGDAANARDHWENGALPGFMVSASDTARSLSRLKRLAWRRNATVVTGHDPGLWDEFKRAPEFYV
jgi:glyoxylase-like metal-dependent hydrolase (beta-lactamase superfamily II)